MAFDRNNLADLTTLKTEVNDDPAGIGYNASSGDTQLVLDGLNLVANNTTPANGNASMTAEAFLSAIFTVSISSQDQFKIQLMFEATSDLDGDLSKFRIDTKGLSVNISSAIDTIIRPLSRAEILFAIDDANGVKEFVIIKRLDWIAARDS